MNFMSCERSEQHELASAYPIFIKTNKDTSMRHQLSFRDFITANDELITHPINTDSILSLLAAKSLAIKRQIKSEINIQKQNALMMTSRFARYVEKSLSYNRVF